MAAGTETAEILSRVTRNSPSTVVQFTIAIYDATVIKRRAKYRLGELIAEQKATVGLAKGTRGQLVGPSTTAAPIIDEPTLASAGISHKLSAAAQKLAKLSAAEFEDEISSESTLSMIGCSFRLCRPALMMTSASPGR
jgi:hypothetical protein